MAGEIALAALASQFHGVNIRQNGLHNPPLVLAPSSPMALFLVIRQPGSPFETLGAQPTLQLNIQVISPEVLLQTAFGRVVFIAIRTGVLLKLFVLVWLFGLGFQIANLLLKKFNLLRFFGCRTFQVVIVFEGIF